ncbi:MAG: hypothetical protein J07AB43_08940 [Candidatus Nanosalina sp. J07AB43]|nr:MAG: hypothetical protein J07AB43_08940 [Candidatus Nanosalina sp. J07AB43]
MKGSQLDKLLEEKELTNSPIKDRVNALEELKNIEPERAESIIKEGLNSESYVEKEVAATVE